MCFSFSSEESLSWPILHWISTIISHNKKQKKKELVAYCYLFSFHSDSFILSDRIKWVTCTFLTLRHSQIMIFKNCPSPSLNQLVLSTSLRRRAAVFQSLRWVAIFVCSIVIFVNSKVFFFFSTNYDGNITDEQLRTRNVHNHLLALVSFFFIFFIATEDDWLIRGVRSPQEIF
jgi:hypothetical protein